MAFPPNWTLPENSTLDGDSLDSARYHALGNAVTPPVAAWLAHRIRLYLDRIRSIEGDGLQSAEPELAISQ
jgi:DNA (cytosine-5)-methyltransferase 1